jgi:hypothetical protein
MLDPSPPNGFEFSGERKRVRCNEGLGSAPKAQEHPGCECNPDEEEDPYAAREEIVLGKDLRQRAMREYKAHEKLEGNGEKQPNEPD